MLPAYAMFQYDDMPPSGDRVAQTLVVAVPLTLKTQAVVGLAANCIIDTPASLSATIA